MDPVRLPGGPGLWRAWWWLVGWNPARLAARVAVIIAFRVFPPVYLTAGAVSMFAVGKAPTTVAGVLLLLGAALFALPSQPWEPGPRVTAESQPDLYRLVERVAGHIGAPMPGRVILDDSASVYSLAFRFHRDLRIGLHVVSVLSRTQLEALVAHELSPLRYRHPWLVLRLRSMRPEGMFTPDAWSVQRTGMLAQLFDFWSLVEDDSDAAAISFGGARSAAEAVLTGVFAWAEYSTYSSDMRAPSGRQAVQNLDDGWRRHLAHSDIHTVDFDYEDEASEHTTLGDSIRGFGQVQVRLADGRVDLAPLPDRDQRWLAERPPPPLHLRRWLVYRLRRWYTFATAPPQWWVDRAERNVEFVRGRLEIPAEADLLPALDDSDEGKERVQLYAEWQLLKAGWRLEHPAVRGVLISPAGDRVDLTTMDRDAVVSLLPRA